MRSTWKRMLSALLTVAMIATLLVVPAAAAQPEGLEYATFDESLPAEGSFFTISARTDKTATVGYATAVVDLKAIGLSTEAKSTAKGAKIEGSGTTGVKLNFTTPDKPGKLTLYFSTRAASGKLNVYATVESTTKNSTLNINENSIATMDTAASTTYGITRNSGNIDLAVAVWYPTVAATSVAIADKTTATVAVDGTLTLNADVEPANTTDEIKWTSTDDTIASLTPSTDGKSVTVTGARNGKATVKVTAGTLSDELEITVGTGVACNHETVKVINQKAASCKEEGYTGDTVCANCEAPMENGAGSVIPKTGHTWDAESGKCSVCNLVRHYGILHVFSDNATVSGWTVPAGVSVTTGTAKEATTGYVSTNCDYGESTGAAYKGVTLAGGIKYNGGTKYITFIAPDAGTATVYFTSAAGKAAAVEGTEKAGVSVTTSENDAAEVGGAGEANKVLTFTTKANTGYTIERVKSNTFPAYLVWHSNDWATYHDEHSYGSDHYCTNPLCAEEQEVVPVERITLTHGAGGDGKGHTIYIGGSGQGDKDSTAELKYPATWKLSATVLPAEADQGVTWSVQDNNAPITVSQEGVVSIKEGADLTALQFENATYTVTATAAGDTEKKDTCDVIVLPKIEAVVIDKTTTETTMGVADADKLTLTASLTLPTPLTVSQLTDNQSKITWSVKQDANKDNISVGENTGVVTPLHKGKATVVATRPKLSDRAVDHTDEVEITINPGTLNMTVTPDNDPQPAAGGDMTVSIGGVPEDKLGNVTVKAQAEGESEITGTREGTSNDWKINLQPNTGAAKTYTITASYATGGDWTAQDATTTVTQSAAGQKTLTVNLTTLDDVTEIEDGSSLVITASPKLDGTATTDVTYAWTKDGETISGQTGATLTVTEAGRYNCTVTGVDSTDTAGLTATSQNPVVVTVKAPALRSLDVRAKGELPSSVTYTEGTPNTLEINGKKTVEFNVTMNPAVNDDTLTTDLEIVNGLALVDHSYENGVLTITPQRASVDENVPRKLTLKGTKNPEAKWEVNITVKKLPAPAVLTGVTATDATAAGGGTIVIPNTTAGKTYRYKLVPGSGWTDADNEASTGWTDLEATGTTTTFTNVAPGTYMVREMVEDSKFQHVSGSVQVVVNPYVAPKYGITMDPMTNGTVTVASEAAAGDKVTVTVTPDAGYELADLTYEVEGSDSVAITATEGVYSFTMPAADVTIYATFVKGEETGCCSEKKPHKSWTGDSKSKANPITAAAGSEHYISLYPCDDNGTLVTKADAARKFTLTGYGTEKKNSGPWTYTPEGNVTKKSDIDTTNQLFQFSEEGTVELGVTLSDNSQVKITVHIVSTLAPVTYTLDGLTADPAPDTVDKGSKLEVTLTPAAGKQLPETATVTMGGTAVAGAYDKDTGKVTIANVTGAVVITATATDKPKDESVTAVTLKNGAADAGDAITLEKGAELTLTAEVTAAAEATNKAVVWSTSDATVVSVDNGKLTALKAGTATVTATADANVDAKDSITVTVAEKSVVIDGIGCAMDKGTEKTLSAKVLVGDQEKSETITWTSSATAVATVADGKVTAVAPGVAVITATAGSLSDSFVVVVYDSTDADDANRKPGTFTMGPAASVDADTAVTGEQYPTASKYFTAVGTAKIMNNKDVNDGKADVFEISGGSSGAFQFTVAVADGKTATATAKVLSTSSTNYSAVGLLNVDTGELLPTSTTTGIQATSTPTVVVVKGKNEVTVVWEGLEAGTYQLVSPARDNANGYADGAAAADGTKNDTNARGVRVTTLSVEQGVDAPAAGDKTELVKAIAAAKAALAAATVADNGDEIPTTETWITAADKATLEAAITAAEALADTATQAQINAAKSAITTAQAKIKAGNKGGDTPVVPDAPTTGTFVLDMKDAPAGKYTALTAVPDLGTEGFFTVHGGKTDTLSVEANNKTIEGFSGTFRMKTGGAVSVGPSTDGGTDKVPQRAIGFTTGAKATVNVWWIRGTSGEQRHLTILDAEGNTVVDSAEALTSNDAKVSTMELPAAGTYYLGAKEGGNSIYKVEVTINGSTDPNPPTPPAEGEYTVTCDTAIVGGSVKADKANAKPGVTVTVTATAAAGYELDAITVKTASGKAVTVTEGKFTMPDENVTVSATFKKVAGVDKTAFDAALAAAKAIKTGGVKISTDGSDVATTQKWVTQAVKDALVKAIADAEGVKDDATQAEIDALTKALEDAVAGWKPVAGTKQTSSGRPTSGRNDRDSNTVKDEKGNTAVKTKDGKGNTVITVTAPDGETVAKVELPATVPSVGYKFVDVPEGHWAEKSINDLAGLGMIKGVDEAEHIYDMASPITRGSVTTILFRLSQGKAGLTNDFTDVADGAWYADSVGWAAKHGVVTGFDNGVFKPTASITREQLAVMLYRYAKLLGMDVKTVADLDGFVDASGVSAWASDAMRWAVAAGIIQGTDTKALLPGSSATRAQTACMIDRFVGLMK